MFCSAQSPNGGEAGKTFLILIGVRPVEVPLTRAGLCIRIILLNVISSLFVKGKSIVDEVNGSAGVHR